MAAAVRSALRRGGPAAIPSRTVYHCANTLALVFTLSSVAGSCPLASPASDAESETRIDGVGTVIIGGTVCQLIALDDGRFVALKSGALPKAPLPVKARIKIVAEPVASTDCAHALSVDVKAFHRLPDLTQP